MLATLAALSFLSAPASYTMTATGLQRPPNVLSGQIVTMNNRDEIIADWISEGPSFKSYATYWKDGAVRVLESPLGGDLVLADINDNGVAVGSMDNTPGQVFLNVPFLWTAEDGFTQIPNDGGVFEPHVINNLGVVGGTLSTETKSYAATWSAKDGYKRYAEIQGYSGGGVVDLNDKGDILYYVDNAYPPIYYLPFGGTAQPLATYPDLRREHKVADTFAGSINNLGWICGMTEAYSEKYDRTAIDATLWSPDNVRFQVGHAVNLHRINDSNVAIGLKRVNGVPFRHLPIIWDQANGVRDLNSVVPAGSPTIVRALAINNQGHILVGAGTGNYILKPN